jgi:hypothetical protein
MRSGPCGDASAPSGAEEELISERYAALGEPGLNPDAFRLAMEGYRALAADPRVKNDSLLTVIDYSLPSSVTRLFVINLNRNQVVCSSLVAHGKNSGDLYARRFSNALQSYQSALGFYITGGSYKGGHGYSMLLEGLEPGFNDKARARAIVIHGADYATSGYIQRYGRLGRSLGCPALPPALAVRVIDLIKEGSVLFSYFPDADYLMHSLILKRLASL